MSRNTVRCLRLLPLASLLLTACTLTQPSAPGKNAASPEWRQHQQDVLRLSQYQTRGAFAYFSDSKKLYARFFWQESSAQRYRLLLTNPLGSTELEIRSQPENIQITDGQGKRYVGKDAESMLQQLSGMTIPLNNLRQWILGLPGDATDFTLDEHALLTKLRYQQGNQRWEVTYQGYDMTSNPPLPGSLELTQGEQRIKLKMDSWTVQ